MQLRVLVLLTVVHTTFSANFAIPSPSVNLEVYALPVGQGDCTIIQCPSSGQLVINDCGSTGGNGLDAQGVRDYLGARVSDITAIFISHANSDHFNYLPLITNSMNMNIRSVIIGGVLGDYPSSIRNWLNDFSTRLQTISGGSQCIGDCMVTGSINFCNNVDVNFNILAANVRGTPNEKSIVLKVSAGTFSILLPGDMEGPASIAIASNPTVSTELQSFVYKIAHHGASRLANQPEWLAPIRPVQAFASSAYNYRNCRHPRCETINRLQNLNTIANAPPHAFYCGNSGAPPTNYSDFSLHIYETSPTSDRICLLTYTSARMFNENCITHVSPVAQPQVSDGFDDECSLIEDGNTGAAGQVAFYPITMMAALFIPVANNIIG